MINTKDLRVGNFVNYIENNYGAGRSYGIPHILEVDEIYKDSVFIEGFGKINFNNISSIQLTEIILLKCGFEKIVKNNEVFYTNGDCFELHQFNQYGHFAYACGNNISGNFVSTRIDSLHQLQNLYFALTGKELEITI